MRQRIMHMLSCIVAFIRPIRITQKVFVVVVGILFAISTSGFAQYLSFCYNNSNFSNQIDTNLAVGVVDGSHGVNATGAANYTIPIACPPGTHGIAPNISLVYNSQGGDGPLGMGWSISGLSAITRTGTDYYHEQEPRPIFFNYNSWDKFALDGTRLIGTGGTYGTNGATYSPEAQNYSVVTSFGNNGWGPDWFQVVAKDGTVMEYGNTTDSKFTFGNNGVLIWRLNKVQDINGNYITFSYTQINNEMLIDEINYTGNANTSLQPFSKIKFVYSSRYDKNTVYAAGYPISSNKLLTEIVVTGENSAKFKTYNFNYGFDNVRSYLQEVIEKGANINQQASTNQLNKTIFKYGQNQLGNMDTTTTNISKSIFINTQQLAFDKNVIYTGDFNGDGISDMVVSQEATQQLFGRGPTTGFNVYITGNPNPIYTVNFPNNNTYVVNRPNDVYSIADFNGDGLDDIVTANVTGNTLNYITIYYNNYPNTTNPFTIRTISPPAGVYINVDCPDFLQLGDFDGDGRTDLLLTLNYSTLWQSYACFPALTTSNNYTAWLEAGIGNSSSSLPDQIHTLDFDGDGKSDILVIQNQAAAINNMEICCNPYNSYFPTLITNQIYSNNFPTKNDAVYIGDFNGDGKADIFTIDSLNSYNGTVSYSTGTGFVNSNNFSLNSSYQPQFSCTYCPCSSWLCGWWPGCGNITDNYSADEIYIGDFNGDGKSDILHYHPSMSGGGSNPNFTGSFDLYYSTGTGFYPQNYSMNTNDALSHISPMRMVADINGDGKSDLTAATISSSYAQTLYFDAHANIYENERLLEKIEDGMDNVIQFDYTPITQGAYTPGAISSYPLDNIQFPLPVVATLYEPNDNGGQNTISYNYSKAQFHKGGRGFLGFLSTDATNNVLSITDHTEYAIDLTYYVPWLNKSVKYSGSSSIAETDNTVIFSGNNGIYTQHLQNSVSNNYLTGATNTTANLYDGSGNLTQSIVNMTVGTTNIQSTTTNASYLVGSTSFAANPYYSVPDNTSITTTRTYPSSQPSVTTAHAYTYNSAGRLSSDVYTVNSNLVSTTAYSAYDNFGNLTSSTATGYNNTAKTANRAYDPKGRFPISTDNGLSTSDPCYQSSAAVFDSLWGKPTKLIDVAGNITINTYDEWGRIKTTTPPTLSSMAPVITTSYTWDIGNLLDPDTYWYIRTEQPGHKDNTMWYNKIGKEVMKQTHRYSGATTNVATSIKSYDNIGNVSDETAPYLPNEAAMHTTYTYGYLNQLSSSTNFQGTTNYAYTYNTATGETTVQTTNPNPSSMGITYKTTDATGKISSSSDLGGTLKFTYDSWGNLLSTDQASSSYSINLKTNVYDARGRLSNTTDYNRGTIAYEYDDCNQVTKETDASGNIHLYTYNLLGHVLTRNGLPPAEGITIYEYYGPGSYNKLKKITNFDGNTENYTYYSTGLLKNKYESYGIGDAVTFYYDVNDVLSRRVDIWTDIGYNYDNYGNLANVFDYSTAGLYYYYNPAQNGLGQIKQYTLGNGQTTTKTYSNGQPTSFITSNNVQDISMNWSTTPIELMERFDNLKHTREGFDYESVLDRLATSWSSYLNVITNAWNTNPTFNFRYDDHSGTSRGNLEKSDVAVPGLLNSDFNYAMHRLTSVKDDPAPTISTTSQQINYTGFNMPANITEGTDAMDFTYDASYRRTICNFNQNGHPSEKREYHDCWERITNIAAGTDYVVNYINGGEGVCAMSVLDVSGCNLTGPVVTTINSSRTSSSTVTVNGCTVTPQIYYVYKDHLGSFLTLTDNTGTIVGQQNFDAWGRMRSPELWDYSNANTIPMPSWMIRGFIGQEHLPQFGLINLNARLYDPLVGRMLGPDRYVSNNYSTQDYNAYSYAHNNPLKYKDPDGNNPLLIAALIGGIVNWAVHGAQFNAKGLEYFGLGMVAGGVGFGIGAGVNVAMAGGSFGAGFMGTAGGISSAGFFAGSASGAAGGFAGGFTSGFGNGLIDKQNIGQAFKSGINEGIVGGISGGVIGGVAGGIKAMNKDLNFFTGKRDFDLSQGFAAGAGSNGGVNIGKQTITGKYVGTFEDADVYESPKFRDGNKWGAVTFPGRGIITGDGVFTQSLDNNLMEHEYGHILQAKIFGYEFYYGVIAPWSGFTYGMEGCWSYQHFNSWTEVLANRLSYGYFGMPENWNFARFPIKFSLW